MTNPAGEQTLTAQKRVVLEELSDVYLECRDIRHLWGRSNDWSVLRNTSRRILEFTRVVICSRCLAERHETYSVPSMEVIRRRYRYPPGFLLHGVTDPSGRTPVQRVRREVLRRMTGESL